VDFGRHGCRGKNGVGLFLVLEGLLSGVMLRWLVLHRRFISTSEKEDASLPIHSLSGFDCESQSNSLGDGN
jgi:hypothetical protein